MSNDGEHHLAPAREAENPTLDLLDRGVQGSHNGLGVSTGRIFVGVRMATAGADSYGAFSRTVEAIYDTTLDPPAWPRALARICDFLGAEASTINYHDLRLGEALLAYEHGTSPDWSRLYHERYGELNPLIPPLMRGPIGRPALIADRMPTEDWRRTRLYREWCAPQRYEDFMDMVVYRDDRHVGALSCVRLDDQPRFGAADLAAFGSIAGHIRRALDISNLFELRRVEADLFEGLVEMLQAAVVVIDRQGRTLQQNERATRWLASLERTQRKGDRLVLPGVDLTRLIETVKAERVFTASLRPSENSRDIVGVTSFGLGGAVGRLRGWPIIVLITGERFSQSPADALLQSMFGLTPAEIRVLKSVLEGRTGPEAASGLGVSLATVRTHIARLLTKTHASNQAELVRIVSSAAGPFQTP